MECNKDEALRAKEIAEKKFMAKDIAGARKFALKAQNLFPSLEGISQMIATLDVYRSSELKVNGERDWYAILCINASADEEMVKKQYRKLALQLHPDKNKSIGAEGAFQLISEAWSILSDKNRKMLYDQKINVRGFQRKTSQTNKDRAAPSTANGFSNLANSATARARGQKSPPGAASAAASPHSYPSKLETFWTSCHKCRVQYEYLRVYLDHNLVCPTCNEPFLASETALPANGPKPWTASHQRQLNSNHNSSSKTAHGPGKSSSPAPSMGASRLQPRVNQWGPFSRTAGAASASASSAAAAQAANVVHQTYEKVRREREEAQAAAKREEVLRKKIYTSKRNASGSGSLNTGLSDSIAAKRRKGVGDDVGTDSVRGGIEQVVTGIGTDNIAGLKVPAGNRCFNSSSMGASEKGRANGIFVDVFRSRANGRQINLSRDLTQMHLRGMLFEKAKLSFRNKLNEWSHAESVKTEEKERVKKKLKINEDNKVEEKDVNMVQRDASNQDLLGGAESNDKLSPGKKNPSNDGIANSDKEADEPVSIDVPDPDFHDFDKDRSERSFAGDQIWATYDNEDGMPRYYAFVQKVLSLKPFKVRMSFLTSKSNSEFGSLNWVASGFAKTCGDFRVGRYEVNDTVNIFSHRVKWEKGPRGVIKIVPRKGDIWALYRDWSPDWDEHTPDEVMYKYDMVEVLDDYNEEQGVSVTPLVKVAGYKTVFHRHLDPKEVKRIPREEMFRFSHQVPSYVLTGEEAPNALKGFLELDPAATPLELLQIINEAKEQEVTEAVEQPVC